MFRSVWDRIHSGTDPLCLHGTGLKLERHGSICRVATNLENMENLENSGNLKNCQNLRKNSGKFDFVVEKTWKLRENEKYVT